MQDLDGSALIGVEADIAFVFQCLQLMFDRRRAFQTCCRADFTKRGDEAALVLIRGDRLEHLKLAVGEIGRSGVCLRLRGDIAHKTLLSSFHSA